jgi:hypothetical protein
VCVSGKPDPTTPPSSVRSVQEAHLAQLSMMVTAAGVDLRRWCVKVIGPDMGLL